MSMYFGKGYLGSGAGGGKPMANRQLEPKGAGAREEREAEPSDGAGDIEEHLRARHAETGHAHSHIEHHGDGRHTSHHIDETGEVSGPHEHGSDEEMLEHLRSVAGGGGGEGESDDADEDEY